MDNYKEIHRGVGISIKTFKPKFPLLRIINETRQVGVCSKCKSSLVRKYLLAFWMPKYCLNKECKNGY